MNKRKKTVFNAYSSPNAGQIRPYPSAQKLGGSSGRVCPACPFLQPLPLQTGAEQPCCLLVTVLGREADLTWASQSLSKAEKSPTQKRKTKPAQRETGSNDVPCWWCPSTGPAVSEGQQTPGPQMVSSLNEPLFLPRLVQVQFPAVATRRFLTSLEASLPP